MSLEYDDSIILVFTPDHPGLIPGLEGFREFIRDTAIVNIIDDDSKCKNIHIVTCSLYQMTHVVQYKARMYIHVCIYYGRCIHRCIHVCIYGRLSQ